MKASQLFSLTFVLILLVSLTGAAGSAPLSGSCVPGAVYDPACDVDHDGDVDILDIQLTAGHWSQSGTYVGDNNHTHLGQTWTGSNNPLKLAGSYGAPDWAPLVLSSAIGDGLRVESAGGDAVYLNSAGYNGVTVNSAGYDGVEVYSAGDDGVHVYHAGSPSTQAASINHDGIEVEGTQGNGLFVGRADISGVHVNSADLAGLYVGSAGYAGVLVNSASNGVSVTTVDSDGVEVVLAGDDGVSVVSAGHIGVDVDSAGNLGVYAHTTQASGQWGFYTPDRIYGTIGMFSAISLVAQVSGSDGLTPGDLVAVAGRADPLPGSTAQMPLVRLADGTVSGVIGVVESRLALTSRPSQPPVEAGETPAEPEAPVLRNADGPAQAGDYVGITVLGAAQVKVDSAAVIEIGQRLTVSSQPGHARVLRTLKVLLADGSGTADMLETAPVVGVAMTPAANGLVWVLVNPQ